MGANAFTAAAILKQLDQLAAEDKFPRLDSGGGCEPAAWRLHAWRGAGRVVPLDLGGDSLEEKGIRLSRPPRVTGAELLRSLLPEHRDLLLADEEELARLVPTGLKRVVVLDEWHHPDIAAGDRPGDCETFQLLAEV